MCGIFGVVYYRNSPMVMSEINDTKELVSNLLEASQVRGRDASGICMVTRDNKAHVLRHHAPGKSLPLLGQYASIMNKINYSTNFKYMIGHTRAKTQGTESKNINNHPIISGKVIGVHNGAISNDYDLFKTFSDKFNREGEVDSEIIFQLLNHYVSERHLLHEAVKKTAEKLSGWYTCAFIHIDHPNYLTIFGDSHPSATIYDFHQHRMMVFASSDKIVYDATKPIGRFKDPTSKLELGGYGGIRINTTNGKIFKFMAKEKYVYTSHYG